MGRKRAFPWRWRLAAVAVLAVSAVGAYLWWDLQAWAPSRDEYPVQGVIVGAQDGDVNIRALRAVGADFVYLEASDGAEARDASFAREYAAARAIGMPVGAIHHFDPCAPADQQAANFVTIVPRDAGMLPPAIELDETADDCENRISEGGVESELTVLLNQVEGHSGERAILKVSPKFEEEYGIAARMERELWLTRTRLPPEYAGRPWMLWTANPVRHTDASDAPLRWVVAQR